MTSDVICSRSRPQLQLGHVATRHSHEYNIKLTYVYCSSQVNSPHHKQLEAPVAIPHRVNSNLAVHLQALGLVVAT